MNCLQICGIGDFRFLTFNNRWIVESLKLLNSRFYCKGLSLFFSNISDKGCLADIQLIFQHHVENMVE